MASQQSAIAASGGWDSRGPILHTKYLVGSSNVPEHEGRFFKKGEAIHASRHPVAGGKHVSGDLRNDGVRIVHQGRRRDNTADIYDARKKQNGYVEVRRTLSVTFCFSAVIGSVWIRHFLIHKNRIIKPQR